MLHSIQRIRILTLSALSLSRQDLIPPPSWWRPCGYHWFLSFNLSFYFAVLTSLCEKAADLSLPPPPLLPPLPPVSQHTLVTLVHQVPLIDHKGSCFLG